MAGPVPAKTRHQIVAVGTSCSPIIQGGQPPRATCSAPAHASRADTDVGQALHWGSVALIPRPRSARATWAYRPLHVARWVLRTPSCHPVTIQTCPGDRRGLKKILLPSASPPRRESTPSNAHPSDTPTRPIPVEHTQILPNTCCTQLGWSLGVVTISKKEILETIVCTLNGGFSKGFQHVCVVTQIFSSVA